MFDVALDAICGDDIEAVGRGPLEENVRWFGIDWGVEGE